MTQGPARSRVGVSGPRFEAPLAPTRHRVLGAHDEWRAEQVAGDDLTAADAEHVEIAGCELRDVRLTGARLEHARLTDVLAVDCELSGAMLNGASLRRVEFRNCRMSGLVIADSAWRDVRFTECKLDGANVRFVKTERVRFDGCSLVEVDFTGSVLAAGGLFGCDLRRAVFTKATLKGTRFAGSTIDGLQGAGALRGAVVGSDQVFPLALALFGDLGISIDDERDA